MADRSGREEHGGQEQRPLLFPHFLSAHLLRVAQLMAALGMSLRQFQTAEDHFSTAIKHNPEKAQYYLHRAKSRQLLQNILGARQDVATVLLLNPNYPKVGSC